MRWLPSNAFQRVAGTAIERVSWLNLVLWFAVSLLSVTAAIAFTWPRITGVVSTGESLAYLPWITTQQDTTQSLTVSLPAHRWTTPTWRIVPDDELLTLSINDSIVPLHGLSHAELTSWRTGFTLDLSPYLRPGINTLVFTIRNDGGNGGIGLQPVLGWQTAILYVGFLPWLFMLGRLFRLQRQQWVPLLVALALITHYWTLTPWTIRTHDVLGDDGHLAYIQRIVDTLTLPKPTENWELFQAPLYYIGGAAIWNWAELVALPVPVALQAYSLGLWLVFLCASAAVLRHGLRFNTTLVPIATAAVALWPSGIMHSIRIGNDVGLYAAAALSMLYLLRWWRGQQPYHLLLSAAFIALGLITKSNALVLAATASLLMLIRLGQRVGWSPDTRSNRPWQPLLVTLISAWAIMSFGAALYLGRNLLYYSRGLIPDWVTGTSAQYLGDWLKVPNAVSNFLLLDVRGLLMSPWAALTDDSTGRGYFWNLLLRTAASGEFNFTGEIQQFIAYLWGGLILAMLMLLLWSAFRSASLRGSYSQLPWLLVSVLWIASLVSFRYRVPYACNNDFRYVLPVLVPIMLVLCKSNIGRVLIGVQCLLSLLFFVTQPFG